MYSVLNLVVQQTAEKINKILKIKKIGLFSNAFWLFKTTRGQKGSVSELEPFEMGNFDTGHPVQPFTLTIFNWNTL